MDKWNQVKLEKMATVKQLECDEQVRNIQETTNHEIESLKFKLEESYSIIEKDRREKLAIQEGLKKAYFKNIVSLNFEACNILGLEEDSKNEHNFDNTLKPDDFDRKTILLSNEVKKEVSPNKRFQPEPW